MSQRRRKTKRTTPKRKSSAVPSRTPRSLRLPYETAWFVTANILDYIATYAVVYLSHLEASPLQQRLVESNPVAAYFIDRWGLEKGLLAFKFAMVVAIVAITQRIASRQQRVAQWVLNCGTLVTGAVVLYSLSLLWRHWQGG